MKKRIETPTFGEILKEEFMIPKGVTENDLSSSTNIPLSRIHALLNNSGVITQEESLRLGRFFGVSDDFFLDIQNDLLSRVESTGGEGGVLRREDSSLRTKLKMVEVKIQVPESMAPYMEPETEDNCIIRNAMIMYPYIKKGVISHGRAAQIIGISKWDLITLYNNMGLPYLSSVSDFKDDLKTIDELLSSEEEKK